MRPPVVIKTTSEGWRVIEELHSDRLADIRTFKEDEHLYFLVQKENFNTLEVVGFLAEVFKQQKISIGYYGRKDKRAVTEQWFSVPTAQKINLDEILAPGIRIIERGRFKKKLRIGEHAYNHFEILLREVKAKPSNKDVCEALEYAVVHQGRRKIFEKPYSFRVHYDEACCTVDDKFCLAPGTYATVFLSEYFDLRETS